MGAIPCTTSIWVDGCRSQAAGANPNRTINRARSREMGMGLVEGKIALVTGAGSGIGRASARLFAVEGARVVVSDIGAASGEETVDLIRASGGEALFIRADASSAADIEAMFSQILDRFCRLDCAVNNAAVDLETDPEAEWDEESLERTLAV